MRLAQAKVHFIGIGGIGMCGLAELLRNMGGQVSGSDLSENAQTQRLRAMGIDVRIGHSAENVHGAECVVYSSAVRGDNPEFREARKLKVPLIPRAEALAEMMRLKRGVAVGGSHGKTTTTSLTASIFLHAQSQPTIVVGGRLDIIKSTALLGQGEWLIAEADESDGSFSRLSPEVVIVTNIDNDHLDHYGTVEILKKAFFDFAMRTPFYGLAIVCGDDPAVRDTFKDFGKRILFYGFGEGNDLRLEGSKGEYTVYREGEKLGSFALNIPGRHNALNACAALAAGLEAGFPFSVCAEGLEQFRGVDRRFQHKGSIGAAGAGASSGPSGHPSAIEVYDDYGHHPTEVRAVLAAFREKFPGRRVVTVFQPHRYSRTHLVWDEFVECFGETDKLFVCDVYAAGEQPIANVSGERLAREVAASGSKPGSVEHLPNAVDRVARVGAELRPGDILVTLGAGDVWKLGMSVLEMRG